MISNGEIASQRQLDGFIHSPLALGPPSPHLSPTSGSLPPPAAAALIWSLQNMLYLCEAREYHGDSSSSLRGGRADSGYASAADLRRSCFLLLFLGVTSRPPLFQDSTEQRGFKKPGISAAWRWVNSELPVGWAGGGSQRGICEHGMRWEVRRGGRKSDQRDQDLRLRRQFRLLIQLVCT